MIQGTQQLAQTYDPSYGGLGRTPKFPNAGVFEIFLRHYGSSKDQRFLEMVTDTLTKMAEGGIYDQLGGGFHRYSVDEKWLIPHFEKMTVGVNRRLPASLTVRQFQAHGVVPSRPSRALPA